MRFRSQLAQRFRKNGYIMIIKDHYTEYYDMYIKHRDGRKQWLSEHPNRNVLIKEAKQISMKDQYGFNPETDVIY